MPGAGEYRGAENVRTVAADRDRLGELALEAGIPAGVLNVVQGYGATAGDALVRHHDVRAVSFTGGTATGRNIMKNAGLKKVLHGAGRKIAGADF